jgi:predicted nucleic acid-binding Zn ribbon protein
MSVDEDEMDDRELPDPSDMDQDDYVVMSRCPHCKKMIDEDADVCPRCGYFITTDESPRRFPIWVMVGIVLMLLAVILFVLGK